MVIDTKVLARDFNCKDHSFYDILRWEPSRKFFSSSRKQLAKREIRINIKNLIAEGSLEAKLPAIWTDGKHSQEEAQTWRKSEARR